LPDPVSEPEPIPEPEPQPTCLLYFPDGTAVHTDRGNVPVENVKVGDQVAAYSDSAVQIVDDGDLIPDFRTQPDTIFVFARVYFAANPVSDLVSPISCIRLLVDAVPSVA
jgi:hypothetical protein